MSNETMPPLPECPEANADWWEQWEVAYIHAYARAYAARAVASEREACAQICDTGSIYGLTKQRREGAAHCANLIRARSKP